MVTDISVEILNVFPHLVYFKENKMSYDRKLKHQQRRIQELVQQVKDLEEENEALNKEIDNLYKINDIRNQELAETRAVCEKTAQELDNNISELKEVREDYMTLMKLTAQTKQHYEKVMKRLLKELKTEL